MKLQDMSYIHRQSKITNKNGCFRWQLKLLRVSTRFGLMAKVCLGFLLFPILRGLSIFRLLGIQFEGSVRYHIWLGTMMTLFAVLHGVGTIFIWAINHQIQNQVLAYNTPT